ncbi:MAG: hypothetical protein ABIP17_01115 [Ilumatobacteraceae bacterium]
MIAAIIGPFAEAVRATVQPCTFLMIVPTATAVIAASARWQALVAAVAAAIVGGWILADNEFLLDGAALRWSAVVVALALVALLLPLLRERVPIPTQLMGRPWTQAAIVAFVVLVATQWWRPCVGRELGNVLSDAQFDLVGQLLPMAFYMLGVMVPIAALVALRYLVEPAERWQAALSGVAGTVGVVIALFLVAGRHESVTVTLTRWTLG